MGVLKDNMRFAMETRGYSENSIVSYLTNVQVFARHFGRSPLTISTHEIESFFHHLRQQNKAEATVHAYYMALRLFFEINGIHDRIPRMKFRRTRCRIPRVLGQRTVVRMLQSCESLKFRTLFSLVYSAGLRLAEVRNLTIHDVDFERHQVFIKASKNRKSRYSILGTKTIWLLKAYLTTYTPHTYLFYHPHDTSTQICKTAIGREFRKLLRANGIYTKGISLHTLRHCFATHLVENGVSIFHVMHLLGHVNISTTMVYLHVRDEFIRSVPSPIDMLNVSRQDSGDQRQLFAESA